MPVDFWRKAEVSFAALIFLATTAYVVVSYWQWGVASKSANAAAAQATIAQQELDEILEKDAPRVIRGGTIFQTIQLFKNGGHTRVAMTWQNVGHKNVENAVERERVYIGQDRARIMADLENFCRPENFPIARGAVIPFDPDKKIAATALGQPQEEDFIDMDSPNTRDVHMFLGACVRYGPNLRSAAIYAYPLGQHQGKVQTFRRGQPITSATDLGDISVDDGLAEHCFEIVAPQCRGEQ